ncbi:plasmid stabilization system protein ParE [Dysgonomonas sp. PFB1-18]|uniref:type II toxin-antitoxin system RelE/ParE family toxin n=1 Tax=unclassified Dysgonomonas TaxID=2630389 RepID=UPI002473F32D|nr:MULTISPECIES: type II toxin-antitoxin system RelE/ParE family toxin [unclassified Dysgonomonas]MDH6309017.1 plasmid stabilization system protein ParE [Dysgonomonas sp. PF1-14]MDH6338768.1 plasmid stabilization system protein ParE [Dysgonomonas sp. PF1-16]MDH6380204.1 plasmid stabilization system protein ParE [Dysgonomonas sp. PFB1-18]MDH6397534.1 plasmid stabilization system protein ParE [Dysgonomonas sp. PF1-23]
MEIIWTKRAVMHLEDIHKFYEEKNPSAANRLYNDLIDSVEPLKDFPQMAQIEPALKFFQKEYRALVVKKTFKIVYYTNRNKIYIVAVLDCRQNPKTNKSKVK